MMLEENVITPSAMPARAPAVERASANLRAALRLLDEPLEVADVLTIERLIGFALADLGEAAETNGEKLAHALTAKTTERSEGV